MYIQQEKDPETSNFHRCSDHAPWILPCRGVPPPRPTRRRPALERGDPHHCRCHHSWRWPICPSSCDPPSPSELQELGGRDGKDGSHEVREYIAIKMTMVFSSLEYFSDCHLLSRFVDVWCCHYPAQSMSCLLLTYGHLRTHPAPLMGELDREAPCDTGRENYLFLRLYDNWC